MHTDPLSNGIRLALLLARRGEMVKKRIRILGIVLGSLLTPVIVQCQALPTSLDILTLQLLGGEVKQTFRAIPAVLAQLPAINLLSEGNILSVVYVSPDRSLVGMLDNTPQTVNAPAALCGATT